MPNIDLAISPNGNLIVSTEGITQAVVGNKFNQQMIYRAMMRAPMNLIAGQQFVNVDTISERVIDYLDSELNGLLDISIEDINPIVTRLEDESINIKLDIPNEGNELEPLPAELNYSVESGFHPNVDYKNNLLDSFGVRSTIEEKINIIEPAIRIRLSNQYSGRGPVRIYEEGNILDIQTVTKTFTIKEGKYKYSVIEILDLTDVIIDTINITLGSNAVIPKAPSPEEEVSDIVYEDGEPFIYTSKDYIGQDIELEITYTNGSSWSDNVEVVYDDSESNIFPMKLNRNIYYALLRMPLYPGSYIVQYNAILYNTGDFEVF